MALLSTIGHQLVIVLAALCVGTQGTYYPNVVYLTDGCNIRLPVQGDMRVKLSPNMYLNPNTQCSITLYPSDSRARLVAKFIDYSINRGYVRGGNNCLNGVESIQLSTPTRTFFGPNGYCDAYRPTTRYDLGSEATFGFKTWPYSQILTADVDLLFTVVYQKQGYNSCPDNTFDCKRKNFCVDEDLTCNGYDDCGNNRDEIEGCGLTPTIIGAIAAGAIVFFILIILLLVFSVRRYRRRAVYIQYK